MTSSLPLSQDLEFEREALMGYKMCLLPCLWMSVLIALNYKLLKIAAYSYSEEHITLSAYSENIPCIFLIS